MRKYVHILGVCGQNLTAAHRNAQVAFRATMRLRRLQNSLSIALLLLLGGNAFARWNRVTSRQAAAVLPVSLIGRPYADVTNNDLRARAGTRCSFAVVFSPTCAYCQRMADSLNEHPTGMQLVLLAQASSQVAAIRAMTSVSGANVRVDAPLGPDVESALAVLTTPSALFVDSEGRVSSLGATLRYSSLSRYSKLCTVSPQTGITAN